MNNKLVHKRANFIFTNIELHSSFIVRSVSCSNEMPNKFCAFYLEILCKQQMREIVKEKKISKKKKKLEKESPLINLKACYLYFLATNRTSSKKN